MPLELVDFTVSATPLPEAMTEAPMTGFSVARSRTLIAMSRPRFLTSLPLAVTLKCFVVVLPPVVIGGRLNVSGEREGPDVPIAVNRGHPPVIRSARGVARRRERRRVVRVVRRLLLDHRVEVLPLRDLDTVLLGSRLRVPAHHEPVEAGVLDGFVASSIVWGEVGRIGPRPGGGTCRLRELCADLPGEDPGSCDLLEGRGGGREARVDVGELSLGS